MMLELLHHHLSFYFFTCRRYTNSVSHGDPYGTNETAKAETKCKGKQFGIVAPKKGRTPEVFFSPSQA